MTNPEAVARDFIEALESEGFPYAIMGGLAVRVHALPRPTYDVDFAAAIPRTRLDRLYDLAAHRGYLISESQRRGWVDVVREMPVVKFQWLVGRQVIDVDVFLTESPFLQSVLSRSQEYTSGSLTAKFVTPEDLIPLKLAADRPRDRADVADLLFFQTSLDRMYLDDWANRLHLSERLAQALADADV